LPNVHFCARGIIEPAPEAGVQAFQRLDLARNRCFVQIRGQLIMSARRGMVCRAAGQGRFRSRLCVAACLFAARVTM
jgi:hypothetical protein